MFKKLFKREVEFNQIPEDDCESLDSTTTTQKQELSLKRGRSLGGVAVLLITTFAIAGICGVLIGVLYVRDLNYIAISRASNYCRFRRWC